MRYGLYIVMAVLAMTSIGCQENVKMEDYNATLVRIDQLERDIQDFKQLHMTQTKRFESLKNTSDSQTKQISNNTEQLTKMVEDVKDTESKRDAEIKTMNEAIAAERTSRLKIEDRVVQALAADQASRKAMEDRFSEAIYERGLALAQFRRILTDFLVMEKELATKLIESKATLETLQQNGELTQEEIEKSKVMSMDDQLWSKRIAAISKALDSLEVKSR